MMDANLFSHYSFHSVVVLHIFMLNAYVIVASSIVLGICFYKFTISPFAVTLATVGMASTAF